MGYDGADLADFLRWSAGQSFAWGSLDCCLWATEWIKRTRRIDPAATLRGTYNTARGCRRVLNRHGGDVLAIARKFFGAAGLEETHEPLVGDVVAARADGREVLGIKLIRGVACKAPIGLTVAPFEILAAWKICPR